MTKTRQRKSWVALLLPAMMVVLAACKGETPTAPPTTPGGGGGTGGGTGQATTVVTLASSSLTPVIGSTITITATVTVNGQPAPNGTAVEFSTTAGQFTDTNPPVQSVVRTTTNGVATVHLSHSAVSTVRVTAVAGGVIRTLDVTYQTAPKCTPPQPGCPDETLPTITGISPTTGKPQGGQRITITGTNIKQPVRVFFGTQNSRVEGFVTNVTATSIEVLTPAFNIGANQQLNVPVTVVTEAGTANEITHTVTGGFTFQNEVLTPAVYSLTPTSGPINGGTRVVIDGEAFQSPVQVFFGSAEVQVVEVDFARLVVISPEARATNPTGSGTVTGPVPVTVVNVKSNTRTTSPQPFRYVAAMQITAISPVFGSALGGTSVTIDGVGFDSPVDVLFDLGGQVVQAQVLEVSGTRLRVRAPALPSPCSTGQASIRVTNVENGDSQVAPTPFQYVGVEPQILSIVDADTTPAGDTPEITPGELVRVRVDDPGVGPLGTANIRFQILDRTLIPFPSQITDGVSITPFDFSMPVTGFSFPTIPCSIGGSPGVTLGPVEVPFTFLNETTGCTDTATVVVTPPSPNPCIVPPAAAVAPAAPNCANAGTVPVADPATGTTSITFTNVAPAGAQNLTVRLTGVTGTNASDFGIAPQSVTAAPSGAGQNFTVTFNPSALGTRTATATFSTNDPNNPTITVCLTGNGS